MLQSVAKKHSKRRIDHMIPLRLHLKNFLSYGTPLQTINFEPYHLICLSGKNGHGKSSLLDAMTWVLWGQARKVTNALRIDEGLLRLGQSDMMVALDFVCNGASYRVRRTYANIPGKTGTQLDFGILDPTTQKLQPLTEKTIRGTQEAINKTIGFDFAAFESSAFLRQGHSDSFSRQSPQDRKETLAHMLGLDLYEQLRKRATEKGKEAARLQQQSHSICELLQKHVQPYPQLVAEAKAAQEKHHALLTEEQQLQKQHETIAGHQKELQAKVPHYQRALAEREHLAKAIEQQLIALRETVLAWRKTHREQLRESKCTKPARSREIVTQELNDAQKQAARRLEIITTLSYVKERLHKRSSELTHDFFTQQQAMRTQVHGTQQRLSTLEQEYQATHTAYQAAHASCIELEKQFHTAQKVTLTCEELRTSLATAETHIEIARRRLQQGTSLQATTLQTIVQSQDSLEKMIHATAFCQTCLQELPERQRERVIAQITNRITRKEKQKKRLERVVHQYQKKVHQATQQIAVIRTQLEQETRHEAQLSAQLATRVQQEQLRSAYQQKLTDLQVARSSMHGEYGTLQASLQLLGQEPRSFHQDSEYAQLSQQIATHEAELQKCASDHQYHHALQEELSSLTQYETWHAHTQHITTQQNKRAQQIRQQCHELRSLRAHIQRYEQTAQEYIQLTQELTSCEEQRAQLDTHKTLLQHKKEEAMRTKGALEQALSHSQEQMQMLQKEQQRLRIYEEESNDYILLAQALSKDGIQGILIEHALPEIEHEANVLLAKLTNNQAQLRFESTRELKSGAVKETLDIKISDPLGLRPYELFSGGEAFRIDFAIRLAISKLLARRSGASIQTLIIDEGFGSQDDEGLGHIMESLYAIQNEFAKIIIVSHLSSMKDQFPVHFHIIKGPKGSVVNVLQQG